MKTEVLQTVEDDDENKAPKEDGGNPKGFNHPDIFVGSEKKKLQLKL